MGESALILASASPRRRELLAQCGCPFTVRPASIEERVGEQEGAGDYVRRVAEEKARFVHRELPDAWVLGSDTEVVLDGRILGKPGSGHEARDMLKALSGRSHQVFSAVVLIGPDGSCRHRTSVTAVEFGALPETWIDRYARSGAGRDKAGAYGIQNEAGLWIRRISGSYSGVVGLPLYETAELLREAGLLSA